MAPRNRDVRSKQILLHRITQGVHEFEHLNAVLQQLQDKVGQAGTQLQQPAAQMLFLYLMSGTDYIPGFKYVTFMAWWVLLLEQYAFVCSRPAAAQDEVQQPPPAAEPIVQVSSDVNGAVTVQFSQDSAARLISAHYYLAAEKKGVLVANTTSWPMAEVYREITARNARDQAVVEALQRLFPNNDVPPSPGTMQHWLDNVYRHSFTREQRDDRTIPPPGAVQQQILRCVYMVTLVYEALDAAPSTIKQQYDKYGWLATSEGPMINWGLTRT